MSFEDMLLMILGFSALLLLIGLIGSIISGIIKIMRIVINCLIINKAGDDFWKGLIPFYCRYVLFDLAFNHKTAVVMFVIYIVSNIMMFGLGVIMKTMEYIAETYNDIQTITDTFMVVALVMGSVNLLIWLVVQAVNRFYSFAIARAFGHETGFCIAAIFFPLITSAILAFGSNEYVSDVTELFKEEY